MGNRGMLSQVVDHVSPERPHVGEPSGVEDRLFGDRWTYRRGVGFQNRGLEFRGARVAILRHLAECPGYDRVIALQIAVGRDRGR